MNLTILSLVTAQSFGISPLITGKANVNSIYSSFSHSFNSIFFSQNIKDYNLKYNAFSFILSSAVVLSSEDQENKKFSKRYSDKGENTKVNIINCLFLKCTSKENGGGIFIGSPTSQTIFTLESSGFSGCQSKNGDAFYSQTKSMTCQNCCIDKCSNSAFYVNEEDKFNFQSNSISNSKLNSDIERSPNFKTFEFINLSFNTDTIRISSTLESELTLSSCEFNSNAGDHLFIISLQCNMFSIFNSNFINNNFASAIVNIKKNQIKILESCFFIEDLSKRYVTYDESSTYYQLRLTNCVFSGSNSQEKEKLPKKFTSVDCVYQKKYTATFAFSGTKECWNKMPKTLPPIHLDANTIFTFGAVIILAIGFIFILCKLRNRNKYTNTMTMYTK